MKKNLDYPHWCREYKSRRHFHAVKRQQMDGVLRALNIANIGSAWFPNHRMFDQALSDLKNVRKAMQKKVWK